MARPLRRGGDLALPRDRRLDRLRGPLPRALPAGTGAAALAARLTIRRSVVGDGGRRATGGCLIIIG